MRCARNTVRSAEIDKLLRAETQITSREQGEDTMNEKGNESKRGRAKKKKKRTTAN